MKAILSTVALLIVFSIKVFSQDTINYQEVDPNLNNGGFSLVDKWPMYPNGQTGINEHIKNNLQYPDTARAKGIEGKVIIEYVIQTDGSVGEVKIIESAHPILDEEAVRVIKLMTNWKPGVQRGKPIKTAYLQAFNFEL